VKDLKLSAMTPTREQILAASSGWVAVVLNVIPRLREARKWRGLARTWHV
jgi:hypothetical protein